MNWIMSANVIAVLCVCVLVWSMHSLQRRVKNLEHWKIGLNEYLFRQSKNQTTARTPECKTLHRVDPEV